MKASAATMVLHAGVPEAGRWRGPADAFGAAAAGRCPGAGSGLTVAGPGVPVAGPGLTVAGPELTGGAGELAAGDGERVLDGGTDEAGFCGSGFAGRVGDTRLARSASSRGPAIPVTGKRCARWNRMTVPAVSTPYRPSMGPGESPAAASRRWSERTMFDPPG